MNEDERMEELAAAQDLRRQIQEKYAVGAREGSATAQSVPEFMSDHFDYLSKVAAGMGFVGDEARAFLGRIQQSLVEMKLPSPLDEPMFHAVIATHCDAIEEVCRLLKLRLRSGVAFGVNPSHGLDVMQHPVPMTEASIVSVSKTYIPFCGIVSKAMARSLPHNTTATPVKVALDPNGAFDNINADQDLKRYWFDTIASFAMYGSPTLVKPDVLSGPATLTRGLLMAAMELFAIAHEYGHHIAYKGMGEVASVQTDNKKELYSEEFEADFLSCVICTQVGLRQTPQNPYCLWGAGGVLVLKSLELVRRARSTLSSGSDQAPHSNTHPRVADRIRAMDAFNNIAPQDQQGPSEAIRKFFDEFTDRLWRGMFPIFSRLHSAGVRPLDSTPGLGGVLSTS